MSVGSELEEHPFSKNAEIDGRLTFDGLNFKVIDKLAGAEGLRDFAGGSSRIPRARSSTFYEDVDVKLTDGNFNKSITQLCEQRQGLGGLPIGVYSWAFLYLSLGPSDEWTVPSSKLRQLADSGFDELTIVCVDGSDRRNAGVEEVAQIDNSDDNRCQLNLSIEAVLTPDETKFAVEHFEGAIADMEFPGKIWHEITISGGITQIKFYELHESLGWNCHWINYMRAAEACCALRQFNRLRAISIKAETLVNPTVASFGVTYLDQIRRNVSSFAVQDIDLIFRMVR